MIKFDDVTETFDNRPDFDYGYLSIKPTESMSDKEISAYIGKAFEEARVVTEFDTYDELLSDVFDCSEDEIDIHFTLSEKTQEILERFKLDEWETMNDSEKKLLLEELTKAIGEDLGLKDIPSVNITELGDSYGFYDFRTNTITLNSLLLADPIEVVDTIAHETRHAYQHMRADVLETREDALYKVNFENYINPIQLSDGDWLFFTDYYNQYIEVDARAFANKVTEAMG